MASKASGGLHAPKMRNEPTSSSSLAFMVALYVDLSEDAETLFGEGASRRRQRPRRRAGTTWVLSEMSME